MQRGKIITTALKGKFPEFGSNCASGTVENSDQSYSASVASGGILTLSDILIGGYSYPAAKDLTSLDWDILVAIAGGIGYNYGGPTGQVTSFQTNDDASVDQNVFTDAVRLANGLKPRNWLDAGTFLTLANNNVFGNTNVWTDSVGAQNYDGTGGSVNNYAINHFTGLGLYLVEQAAASWSDAITASQGTFAGFSDWFLPNINQIFISYQSAVALGNFPLNYSPFSIINPDNNAHWTSTTQTNNTSRAYQWSRQSTGLIGNSLKTASLPYILFRKHY